MAQVRFIICAGMPVLLSQRVIRIQFWSNNCLTSVPLPLWQKFDTASGTRTVPILGPKLLWSWVWPIPHAPCMFPQPSRAHLLDLGQAEGDPYRQLWNLHSSHPQAAAPVTEALHLCLSPQLSLRAQSCPSAAKRAVAPSSLCCPIACCQIPWGPIEVPLMHCR